MNDRKIIWRCLTMFDNVWRCLIKWNNSWLRILVNNSTKSSSRVLQIILFQSNPNIFFLSSFSKIFLSCKELKFILNNLFIILISYRGMNDRKIIWRCLTMFGNVWQRLTMFGDVWRCLIKWNNSWHTSNNSTKSTKSPSRVLQIFTALQSILLQFGSNQTNIPVSPRRERPIIRIINPRRDEFPLFTQPPVPRISNNLSNERYSSTSPPSPRSTSALKCTGPPASPVLRSTQGVHNTGWTFQRGWTNRELANTRREKERERARAECKLIDSQSRPRLIAC